MATTRQAASKTTRSIYGIVLLSILPVVGITLIGLMISWSTVKVQLFHGMMLFLSSLQRPFKDASPSLPFYLGYIRVFTYIDMVLTVISPFADWYWLLKCEGIVTLNPRQLTLYCILTGYMASMAVVPKNSSWNTRVENDGIRTMERFDIVWVTRSASLVSESVPDLIWSTIVNTWGEKNAQQVCRISLNITDQDKQACSLLRKDLRGMGLYQNGSIKFGRPNFSDLIKYHTIELISTRRRSRSLLAYAGSPELTSEIHHSKITNDMVTAITGNKRHQMNSCRIFTVAPRRDLIKEGRR
jgi:hypothetical protein